MFNRKLVSALGASCGILIAVLALSPVANASAFGRSNIPAFLAGAIAPIVQIRNKYQKSQHDSYHKYNPNAAAIGQMLGGAKSLDLGGIGGAGYSSQHVAYCAIKYGSYNARDNTFLSFSLERKQCKSPYMDK